MSKKRVVAVATVRTWIILRLIKLLLRPYIWAIRQKQTVLTRAIRAAWRKL